MENLEEIKQRISQDIPGIRTRVTRTSGGTTWLDVTNEKDGLAIEFRPDGNYSLTSLPADYDWNGEFYTNKNKLVERIKQLLG